MNTETENGMPLISDQYGQMMFRGLTAGVSAHPAKISVLQESEQDLTATEVPSFGRYFELCGKKGKKISLSGLSMRMLRECLAATEDLTSLPFCLKWTNWGYDCEWFTFNSKYHGVPQNRERVYTVGHLRAKGERKIFPISGTNGKDSNDVMQIGKQKSNRDNPNQYRVYDMNGCGACLSTMGGGGLEPHTAIPMFGIDKNAQGSELECANALTAREDRGISNFQQTGTAVCIPVLTPDRAEKRQNGRRFKDNGEESFTLTSQDRHGVAIKVREATKKGYSEAEEGDCINIAMPESKTRRGRVGKGVANTLDCSCEQAVPVIWYDKYKCYIAIRKLTPRECFRLQGWEDKYFERAQFVNSDSQLYKQAGNGVTVAVVEDIAKAIGNVRNEENENT